jgi:hypothetical protein
MSQYDQLASKESIDKTIESLQANNIDAKFVQTGKEAYDEVFKIVPKGAEVMTMSSVTLDTLGISKEVQESYKYNSVKNKLAAMNRETQSLEMLKIGAAPEWSVGSVNVVTEDGHVLIASNTGSQLPAYASAAAHVIWIVGIQKIVKSSNEAFKRIYDYVLPLESDRLNKLYNLTTGSFVSKILIINREIKPGRITLIFVGEKLGF